MFCCAEKYLPCGVCVGGKGAERWLKGSARGRRACQGCKVGFTEVLCSIMPRVEWREGVGVSGRLFTTPSLVCSLVLGSETLHMK